MAFGFPIFQSRMSGEESSMQERAMRRDERMHKKFGCNGSDRCLGFHYGGEIRERYRERYIPLPRSSVVGKKVMNSEEDTPPVPGLAMILERSVSFLSEIEP